MIAVSRLYECLQQNGIEFFTGVPDSLLKDFLKYLDDREYDDHHIITANEGLAIGLAAGYHFETGKLPLIYLQNSGLGNTINPLTSLADKEVYAVPMILMIGWRGRPGITDEPQHIKMGRITIPLLEALEIPMYLFDEDEKASFSKIAMAAEQAKKEKRPVALVIPEGIFEKYEEVNEIDEYPLEREYVIQKVISSLAGSETVVCTTGKIGREFYEQNEAAGKKIRKYLLSAGAMGHASHIALGIHLHSNDKVILLDGDGALLMHLGALPTIASHASDNFIHILINNGSHESVGGQPSAGFSSDLAGIASASGFDHVVKITDEAGLENWLNNGLLESKAQFVEIRTNKRSRKDLGRPKGLPVEWKEDFMRKIE
jgi:phosphonopyruvate decarboxylase